MSSVVILSLCVVGCVFCGMGVYAGDFCMVGNWIDVCGSSANYSDRAG